MNAKFHISSVERNGGNAFFLLKAENDKLSMTEKNSLSQKPFLVKLQSLDF